MFHSNREVTKMRNFALKAISESIGRKKKKKEERRRYFEVCL
jgi:hypothetical protein